MYKSQALLILSIPLALLSIFSFLYGVVFQTSKLSTKAERSEFENAHQPYFQPQADKVIFIVIDALRFDFFINQGQDPDLPENWKDHQFRKFMKKIWETPENSVLLKAHVDAPTLTTARVPSMMTGNFPRKASNFHHNTIFPISEDNILYQMKKAGRKMYYGGDPIWPVYFPDAFVDSISERDYDIKMTDVDDEVYDFVYDVFKNKTYDLLIGHFLGLDHMGHGGGFSHPSTIHAKNKIEQFLLKIMEEMDDQTTLLVLGDHGAELNGEHGKDSPGESYVPIAGYNKKGFFKNSHHSSFAKAMKYLRNDDVVKQVDLTPTLAMLMGVPVPFSNAGQVLNDFYPAREFPANQACQNRTFELQLLYNNYANSEQIMKYLEEKQTKQAKIFDEKYFKELQDEFKKLNANFKKLLNKVHDTEACEKIHEPILNTIGQAQKFSNKAYDLIKNTNPYDFSMALAGVAGLTLLLVSYILLSQILQVEGYRRQTHFKLNSFLTKRALTRYSLFIILATISFTLTKKLSSTITICSFVLNLIFCGSLLISFVKLQKVQTKSHSNTPPSYSKEIEGFQAVDSSPYSDQGQTPTGAFNKNSEPETPHTPMNDDEAFKVMPESKFAAFIERVKGLKEKFSSPQIYNYSAIAIIAATLYLTFTNDLAEVRRAYFIKHTPILSFMLIGFLIAFNVKRFFRHIIAVNLVVCSIVYFGRIDIYSWRRSAPLGIVIISEWYFKEIYFMLTKLKTTKIMALLQFSSVIVLFAYLLDKENPEVLYKLTLPRVIWGLMLASIVAGKIQKISGHATKRNLQFCFVILLLILRLKKQILTFAVLLQLMNLTNKVFQRVNIKNTLYPTVLAFLGYMGLYFIYMTEQYVPFTYVPASLGKTDYDYIISPLFFMIYLLCTFILASLFMSYYNQQIELDAQTQDSALPQIKSENQDPIDEKTAVVIKRRNVFPLIIFYSVLVVSVSIQTLYLCVKNEPFTFERFLLNSGFYLYVLVSGIFLIK